MKSPAKRIFLLAGLVIIISGLIYIGFNGTGLIKYIRLKNEVEELKMQIKTQEEKNKKLSGEIDSLKKNIPSKIEQIAREKYKMSKPNEKSFEVKIKE